MKTRTHDEIEEVLPQLSNNNALKSPCKISNGVLNFSYSKDDSNEYQLEQLDDTQNILSFSKNDVSPIERLPSNAGSDAYRGFFNQSPVLDASNKSFNQLFKKMPSSQIRIHQSPIDDKSFNMVEGGENPNYQPRTPDNKKQCIKDRFTAPSTAGMRKNRYSSLILSKDDVGDFGGGSLNKEGNMNSPYDDHSEYDDSDSLFRASNKIPQSNKYIGLSKVNSTKNGNKLDEHPRRGNLNKNEYVCHTTRKLTFPCDSELHPPKCTSFHELGFNSQPEIYTSPCQSRKRPGEAIENVQMLQILDTLDENDSSNFQNDSNDDISPKMLKESTPSKPKRDRLPKAKLRLKKNNNINLNMDSEKSAQLSPHSAKRKLNLLRSNTLKRSGFENLDSRMELSRKDSCEPVSSHNISYENDGVYYGDNKFVNSKNNTTHKIRKTSNIELERHVTKENQFLSNFSDTQKLKASKSRINLLPANQLFDVSLSNLKQSEQESIKHQDNLTINNNCVQNRNDNFQIKNAFQNTYHNDYEGVSNYENVGSKQKGGNNEQIVKYDMKMRNNWSRDSLFGSTNQFFGLNNQKKFKTVSQALFKVNHKSGVNNIEIDDDENDDMSRRSSPVKLNTLKSTKSKNFFDFPDNTSKKRFLDDVHSSVSKNEKKSIFHENYEVLENLGSGHFGTVYKCKNKFDGLIYAIKVLKTATKTAINEAQALASLNVMYESTYIVRYFSSWKEDNTVYIVMEMCSKNLEQWSQQNARIEEKTLRKIIKHLCKSLSKLHKDKVVHLDIKPENILIGNSGKFKVSDLGLVKLLKNKDDVRTLTEGDARYMAKELLQEYSFEDINTEKADLTKADIFSLGITIYELMTRNMVVLPKNGPLWHKLRDNNLPALDKLSGYSNSLKRLVSAMMDSDPSKRPSAKEIINTHLLYSKYNKIQLLKEQIKLLKEEADKRNQLNEHSKFDESG